MTPMQAFAQGLVWVQAAQLVKATAAMVAAKKALDYNLAGGTNLVQNFAAVWHANMNAYKALMGLTEG